MKSLVELRDVTFGYGEHPVLENVTFRITEKDYILVIGPNGGGKTTLLKLILGIEKPWSGSVTLRQGIAERMGYVPQYATLNRNFPISVLDMVLTGLVSGSTYLSSKHPSYRERALEMIENVGLQEKREERIARLSGGQLQRALIARALVSDPLVLFLDEPTASMDITARESLLDFLERLNKDMAVIVVTHDPTPFARTYKHILCVNRKTFLHGQGELDSHTLEMLYGCPVALLGHGIPHTLLRDHDSSGNR